MIRLPGIHGENIARPLQPRTLLPLLGARVEVTTTAFRPWSVRPPSRFVRFGIRLGARLGVRWSEA